MLRIIERRRTRLGSQSCLELSRIDTVGGVDPRSEAIILSSRAQQVEDRRLTC